MWLCARDHKISCRKSTNIIISKNRLLGALVSLVGVYELHLYILGDRQMLHVFHGELAFALSGNKELNLIKPHIYTAKGQKNK